MHIEKQKNVLTLSNYSLSFISNDSYVAICNLDVGHSLRLFCRISLHNSPSGTSDIEILLNSVDSKAKNDNMIYVGRIKRILMSVIDLDKFDKTKLLLEIDIIHNRLNYDIYHHLLNLISITMLFSNIDLKMMFVASSIFVDRSGRTISEVDLTEDDWKTCTQVFLCKDLTNNDGIISFKIHGNLKDNSQMGSIFSVLIGSCNQIGQKLIEFIVDK